MSNVTVNIEHRESTNTKTESADRYFLRCLKYEQCVYIVAILGAVSQFIAVLVIILHLAIGLDAYVKKELKTKTIVYSAIGIKILTWTALTEVLLMCAVKTRFLRYIQWWMVSTMIILIFTSLLTVIAGFTLYDQALWITLAFLYLIIRLPFQVHFVDKFTHVEIIYREPQSHDSYKAVRYNRFI